MIRIMLRTALLMLCTVMMFAAQAQDANTVLTVADEHVSIDDFEAIFKKNNRDSVITKESLDEYMELFINFKLKVKEAEALRLDTSAVFQRELRGYRKQLARPYLIDNELLDELIEEAYQRKTQEVRASHILIKVDQNAAPEDTLKAYERIIKLRERILAGEDFATVAQAKGGSEDPSVRDNAGDLGYFTAFQMVYPFESAAFNTPVGEVSMPIRTRFGYHIVKVTDKRKARGEIRVAHIMIRHKDKNDPEARAEAEARAMEIYEMLRGGEDFSELAMRYSQDASTSQAGGELPWFGAGKMVEEFENAAFALSEDGQISEPVESPYGYHIIKRLEYRPVPEFEEVRQELKSKVSRDSRADVTRESFMNKLRETYNVEVNKKMLKPLYKAAQDDSAFVNNNGIKVKKEKKLKKELFSIDGKVYTTFDFYKQLNNSRVRKRGMSGEQLIDNELEKFIETELMTYEDSRLEDKHNEFRLLINEYHDGILLFELTDQMVWSKAVKDTAGLEAFYEENKNRFMWDTRYSGTIYSCENGKVAKTVERMIRKDKTAQEIKEAVNEDSNLNVRIEAGIWEQDEKSIFAEIEQNAGVYTIEKDEQVFVIELEEVRKPEPKALNEARGMVTAEYQNHLEEAWIEELRSKYDYKVNKEVLYSIL